MKTIQLTQDQFAKVSDGWFEKLNIHKWQAKWSEHTQSYYAVRRDWGDFGKTIYMAREIANTPDDMICDHRNHDTLDNQDDNLRNVTHSQNMMNQRMHSDNQIGEKNIHPHYGGFEVQLRKNGKKVFCKTFPTLEAAIIARDEAIKIHHGEFGNIT